MAILFFNIWPCTTLKSCPKSLQFFQSRLKICQTLNKPSFIWQKFIKCCQSGEISHKSGHNARDALLLCSIGCFIYEKYILDYWGQYLLYCCRFSNFAFVKQDLHKTFCKLEF